MGGEEVLRVLISSPPRVIFIALCYPAPLLVYYTALPNGR
jgi:hypothetical protein